jgi:UDP-sugar transporter A1/2/3
MESKDRVPLLSEDAAPAAPKENRLLKYGSLGFLIIQNSSHVLLLRHSRIVPGLCSKYIVSVAVLYAELLKLVFCLVVLCLKEGGPFGALALLNEDVWQRKADTLKVSVPALCYTLQNNLQFVAASHLGAELLQLLYQTKTLSTAIFGVIILAKSLRCNQWCALSVLVVGVVLAQASQSKAPSESVKGGSLVGVLAALGVSVCSGFASVYLEKILKGDKCAHRRLARPSSLPSRSVPAALSALSWGPAAPPQNSDFSAAREPHVWPIPPPPGRPGRHAPSSHPLPARIPALFRTSLWVRNVQLCLFSIPLQLFAVWQRDYHRVLKHGWLHGFCPTTWAVVCMFAFGGLLVAVVIRFADNNLKNLAMAVAILVSCLASVPLFGFAPNGIFGAGAALVISSIFLYAWHPKPPATTAYLPVADSAVGSPSKA